MSAPERTHIAPRDAKRAALARRYRPAIEVHPALSRALVSYQSNRDRPFYRWFKYKEGFSAALVEYVIEQFGGRRGLLFDPFAGTGSSLFSARDLGWRAEGIELLPVGVLLIRARLAAEQISPHDFRAAIEQFRRSDWREHEDPALALRHVTITRGAFTLETERDLMRFRTYVRDRVEDPRAQLLFETAGLCVLEAVSFTLKDGQYLRWDVDAPRPLPGRRFRKKKILKFEEALEHQFSLMVEDVEAFEQSGQKVQDPGDADAISISQGSCLHRLPQLPSSSVDLIVTSPPYCNRYDYTRTYALELAYLGIDDVRLKKLRQSLFSCTVENLTKIEELQEVYSTIGHQDLLAAALEAFEKQPALQEVLDLLDELNRHGELNNMHVPRMVRNYFVESAVVIFELSRLLRPGGSVVMINDNVQYAGEEVPVDLIFCELAAAAGLRTEHLWTLSRGKGNSSQQMGAHGRRELRKCAYVWRKDV